MKKIIVDEFQPGEEDKTMRALRLGMQISIVKGVSAAEEVGWGDHICYISNTYCILQCQEDLNEHSSAVENQRAAIQEALKRNYVVFVNKRGFTVFVPPCSLVPKFITNLLRKGKSN